MKQTKKVVPTIEEIKEDDAERIKKNCIHFLELQKQHHAATFEIEECIAWIKKQGKKSTDKNKPRFNVGDWVVNKFGDSWYIDSLDKKNYQVSDGKGNYNYFPISKQDEMHLWTIQDAKGGDVISFYSEYKGNKMVQIGIIEKYVGKYGGCSNTFKIYVGVNWDNNLQIGKYMGCSVIHPATKEQRDTFMKVMNDAGYEWDTEKKELKKKKK